MNLDDPISKYIPEFKNPQVIKTLRYSDTSYTTDAADKEISIRHLLTHTSGIGYGVIDGDERFKLIYQKAGIIDLFTTENISIEENIKKLAKLPLHHNPGDKFTYSEGLDVLGYFIEVMSGMAFGITNEKGQSRGGRGSVGTFDWGGYFNTLYFADPKENIIGVLMKQTRDTISDDTGWKFRLLVGQAVDN